MAELSAKKQALIEKSTGQVVDGVFASQVWDSSAEIIDIDTCDISEMEEGRGLANYEHRDDESEGATGQDIVGKIILAKKIFSLKDCDDEREGFFWNKVKAPFIYGMVRLYDGAGHLSAQGLAAQIRDAVANNELILVRFSIDGNTIERQGNQLKRTLARRVAMTIKPCNRTCDSGLVSDPNAPEGFDKSPKIDDLVKFERTQDGLFHKIGAGAAVEQSMASLTKGKKSNTNRPHWSDGQGVEIPRADHPDRAAWDKNFDKSLKSTFGKGKRIRIPVAEATPHNGVRNYDRYDMYREMAAAGDPLPPVIVSRGAFGWNIHDGSHRWAAAQKEGVDHIDAIDISNTKMKKAITAGGAGAAPSQLTGGAALSREDVTKKISAVLKSFDADGPDTLRDRMKTELGDVSDEYLDYFTNLAEEIHARLKKMDQQQPLGPHMLISGDGPLYPSTEVGGTTSMHQKLLALGEHVTPVKGRYGGADESSLMISHPKRIGEIRDLGRAYGQESVIESDGNKHRMLMLNGPNAGLFHPGEGTTWHKESPGDYFTTMPDGRMFTHGINFEEMHPDDTMQHMKKAVTNQPPEERMAYFRSATNRSVQDSVEDAWGPPNHALDPGVEFPPKDLAPASPEPVHVAPPVGHVHGSSDDDMPATDANTPLTIRGEPVAPNPAMKKGSLVFNEHTGELHAPFGTFKLYNPDADGESGKHFKNVWDSPAVRKQHDYAVGNWIKLNQALKEGRLPEAVLATSVAFSQLSPNTPVPVHEMMYAYLLDTFKHKGKDIRDPTFGAPDVKNDWISRDRPDNWPESSRDYFTNEIPDLVTNSADSLHTGRLQGERSGFMLPNNKFLNMARYSAVHQHMKDLISRHGVDARSAVAELMRGKSSSKLWEAQRKRATAAGKPDPGEFSGLHIPGLAPKTARFAYAMMGAGNSFVPDTHFARHLFGLDKNKDAATIRKLRNGVLWNEKNSDLLNAMDRWYYRNHPAVKMMMEHPVHGDYFKANPEQAVFPAFWGHWLSISPHERLLGHRGANVASNQAASHRPLFEEVDRLLADPNEAGKTIPARTSPLAADPAPQSALHFPVKTKKSEGGSDQPLIDPRMAAGLLAHWVQQYGHGEAMLRYYSQLLPLLMHEPANEDDASALLKKEAIEIDIAAAALRKDETQTAPGFAKKPAAIEEHPPSADHTFTVHDTAPRLVNTPEQMALVDGLSTASRLPTPKHAVGMEHINHKNVVWARHPQTGKPVFMKRDDFSYPHGSVREAVFHNLARDFFGLGRYIPTTAQMLHPDGTTWSAQEAVQDSEHFKRSRSGGAKSRRQRDILLGLGNRGELHKLAFMDTVLGNSDRHEGNYLFDKDSIKLIDHGHVFSHPDYSLRLPNYLHEYETLNAAANPDMGRGVHPEAAAWIRTLDPAKLEALTTQMGVGKKLARGLAKNLQRYKEAWTLPRALPRPAKWHL